MSVDDQLFKDDGTRLTRADIIILKAARWVANVFFAEEDDETYDRALKGAMRLAAIMMALSTSVHLFRGAAFSALGPAILSLLYWVTAHSAACNGRGTNIPHHIKKFYLFSLLFFLSCGILGIVDLLVWGPISVNALGLAFFISGSSLYYLANGYIRRLQNKPPKRKKAHALKLALGFNR